MGKEGAGGKGCDWEASRESESLNMQRVHSAQVYVQAVKTLHSSIPVPQSVAVLLGSGPEAGAYLVAEECTSSMNDRDLITTIRRRLRVTHIEGSTGVCQHARTNRTTCGVVHGHDGGTHAVKCNIGGGVSKRHDYIRDALN